MRTTNRLCVLMALTVVAACVAVPATAGAKERTSAKAYTSITKFEKKQNRRIKRAHTRIGTLKEFTFGLNDRNNKQDETISGLAGTVSAIVAGVPEIIGALTALEEGLIAAGDGLNAIDAALNDPVTGLVGLNLARPQFGAFEPDGTFIDGTGAQGGQGPSSDATPGTGVGHPGLYVVDFHNDITSKFLVVDVFPYIPAGLGGGGATPNGEAIACQSDPSYASLCEAITGDTGDDPGHVLVQIGDGTSAVATGFNVAAISG